MTRSADEIVIPVNKPVRLILNSKDVIHSFYMPHFRVQLNTVPGMTSYFEFTPTITTAEMKAKTNDPNFQISCSYVPRSAEKVTITCKKKLGLSLWQNTKHGLKEQATYLTDDLRKEFNMPVTTCCSYCTGRYSSEGYFSS